MTVIPVTEEDYNNRQHFQNVNQMQQYRKQNINPMNEDDAKEYFIQKSNSDINQANDIAYQLMKQAEENEAQQGLFGAIYVCYKTVQNKFDHFINNLF